MSNKTGGPAFPNPDWKNPQNNAVQHYPGMTLRDYFAAKAMPSLLLIGSFSEAADEAMRNCGLVEGEFDKFIAKVSYKYADAMLKAREK